MRRLLWLSTALFLACSSASTGSYTTTYTETQACYLDAGCAGTVPTAYSSTVGANLAWSSGSRLRLCAASGQTLSGTGTMHAYLCDQYNKLCYHNKGLDQSVTVSGERCQSWPDFLSGFITEAADGFEFVADGVGSSISLYPDAGLVDGPLTVEILTRRERR